MKGLAPPRGWFGLCLLLVCPAGVSAQPPPVPGLAWLEFRCDNRGNVRVTLQLPFRPSDPALWQTVLSETLQAPLHGVRTETMGNGCRFRARADAVLNRSIWRAGGDVDFAPLLRTLNQFGVTHLVVGLAHPNADFSDFAVEEAEMERRPLDTHYQIVLATTDRPQPIHAEFGFHAERAWRLSLLTLLLAVPIVLTLRVRHRLFARKEDRFWTFLRMHVFLRRLALFVWLVWPVCVLGSGGASLGGWLLCGWFGCGDWVGRAMVVLLPPALTLLICRVLAAPLFALVPEVGWTRGRLFQQALWSQFGAAAVGLCLTVGVDGNLADPSLQSSLPSVIAAGGVVILCSLRWIAAHRLILDVLPSGELRQRLVELTEQTQVRVRQIYVLPPAHWRLLSIFGGWGNCVHLTAEALPHLSRREVDALLAFGLARVWRGQRRTLGRLVTLFVAMAAVLAGFHVLMTIARPGAFLPLLPFIVLPVLIFGWPRRSPHFSPRLDGDVLALVGDPEALLTALAKLRRLALMPLLADESAEAARAEPENWPRWQKLAERAGIPPERQREILNGPVSGTDRYPPLPRSDSPPAEADSRLLSREGRQRISSQETWLTLAVEIAIPVATVFLVQGCGWHGGRLLAAYLVGGVLAFLLVRFAVRLLGVYTDRILRRRLHARLMREGVSVEATRENFVGLSPQTAVRFYEGMLVWDVGFLVLADERLCYFGDRTRFVLQRRQIADVSLIRLALGWRSVSWVRIDWRDGADVSGSFMLLITAASWPFQSNPGPARLVQRLRRWLDGTEPDAKRLPPAELPPPDFASASGESAASLGIRAALLPLLFFHGGLALVVSWLLGLSFTREAGAAGWYVVATAAFVQLVNLLPWLRPHRAADGDG